VQCRILVMDKQLILMDVCLTSANTALHSLQGITRSPVQQETLRGTETLTRTYCLPTKQYLAILPKTLSSTSTFDLNSTARSSTHLHLTTPSLHNTTTHTQGPVRPLNKHQLYIPRLKNRRPGPSVRNVADQVLPSAPER